MPILNDLQRRTWAGRSLVAIFYLLLTLGAATMVYPFLLMLSGSLKSDLDAHQLEVIPRFFLDDAQMFRKFEEQRYGRADIAAMMTRSRGPSGFRLLSFSTLAPPPPANPQMMADWDAFLSARRGTWPEYFQALGYLYAPHAVAEIGYRYRDALRRELPDALPADWNVLPKCEEWWNASYHPPQDTFGDVYFKMRRSLPDRFFTPISVEGVFAAQQVLDFYGSGPDALEKLNRDWNRHFSSLLDVTLRSSQPENLHERQLWGDFVRNRLSARFLTFDPALLGGYQDFLRTKYPDLASASAAQGQPSTAWDQFAFPTRSSPSAAFSDAKAYLRTLPDLSGVHIHSPDIEWRDYLRQRYAGSLPAINQAWQSNWDSFEDIAMPILAHDAAVLGKYRGEFWWEFVTLNYRVAWSLLVTNGRGLWNTIIFCALNVLTALIVNPLAAYALSRYRLRGKQAILFFLMATMAFPAEVTQIPSFLLLRDLGWLNTFAALVIPAAANGYMIFLLKGFFDSLPQELYEAADIDGCGPLRAFWSITLPLSTPILAVVALGAFNSAYGAFMFALLVCQKESMWTLMVYIYQMQQTYSSPIVFAALVIAAIPTLVVFVFCQKLIMRGIVIPVEK